MSDSAPDTPPPADTDATAVDPQLARLVHAIDQAVDGIFFNAINFQRVIGLNPHEVPRLCVQAACRGVERLVESYQRRRQLELSGQPVQMSLEERDRRQREIALAAEDLERVLTEGLASCQQIRGQVQADAGRHAGPVLVKPN